LSGASATSLGLDVSGILSGFVNAFFLASSCFLASFVGEEDRDADDIQDFLLSIESERAGDSDLGDSVCLRGSVRVSVRLRSGFGSAEWSRLLLEKDRNLDDRRELLGLNCGRISKCSSTGASSESGLDPSEDE
jgi:hypothetical protein